MTQTAEEKREKARWSRIKRVYGLEKEQYELLNTGACPICLRGFNDTIRPVIDHNHQTGEVRGVVCSYCNFRIIARHNDPVLVGRLARYLENHTGWIVPPKPKKKRKTKRK